MKRNILLITGVILMLMTGMVTAEKLEQPKDLKRAVIRIDSITCGGCFSTINAGMAELEGFSGIGANLFRKLIAIDFTAPLTVEEISARLEEIGYPGELESVDPVTEKESFAYLQSKRSAYRSASGCGGCSLGGSIAGQEPAPGLTGGSCCDLSQPGPPDRPTENL